MPAYYFTHYPVNISGKWQLQWKCESIKQNALKIDWSGKENYKNLHERNHRICYCFFHRAVVF